MIEKIIKFSTRNPWLVISIVCFFAFITIFNFKKIPLDALPDLSENQVIVFTEWPGRSPQLIEDQITYPLVTQLLSAPKVKYVRAISMFGASQISVVFSEDVDLYWARSRISEKISAIKNLPDNVTATLAADATGLGWVYQYALVDKTGNTDLSELRSLQDWNLRFALQAVPGVAEVAAVGGFVKEYQVNLDPIKLQALYISPLDVIRAIRQNNQEIGAGVIEMAGSEFVLRGRGYLKSITDIENVPIKVLGKGKIIKISEVSVVNLGPAPRSGIAELDGEGETVGGIVIMRYGENALKTIEAVKSKIESVKATLPKGVEIIPVYDRSDLIGRAISTLKKVLMEEIIVVALIVSLFLWHARASFVAIIPLPIAVLFSFFPLLFTKTTINIMSLGGIAIAIGAMVDSGIILIENAHKKLEVKNTSTLPEEERRSFITQGMIEMGRPLFFSLLVLTVSFLPIFALQDREGKLFHPLALTKTACMGFAAILAITLIPALAILFLRGKFVEEKKHNVSVFLHRIYTPILHLVLRFPKRVIGIALLCMALTAPIYLKIQSEFMPPLNEGTILYMPTSLPGMSIDTAIETLQKQNTIIKNLPEVEHVFGKAGRSNSPTDPAPMNMFETVITLKPKEQWRSGMTFEKIISDLDNQLTFPGMPNIWWMPIQTRIEMLTTGIRSAVGIKVLGNTISDVQNSAIQIEELLKKVPGTHSVFAERFSSGNYVDITINKETAALYGLNVADVFSFIEAVTGTQISSVFIDGKRERYNIKAMYARDFRNDVETIKNIVIPTPTGTQIQLKQIMQIETMLAPPMIATENGKILGIVFIDVDKDVGIGNYVGLAKKELANKLTMPPGVQLVFSGQYEALERAESVLHYIIPVTLAIIVFLLYFSTKSMIETSIVLLAVPFSLIGAFWLMYLLSYKLSVAAWVGLIALAGLDAETGVVMLLYLTQSWKVRLEKNQQATDKDLVVAIHEGAVKRVRPKLMTIMAALIGLMPVMWSTGAGADVMKRIAAPMVGGLVTSGILELLVYPAIFMLWQGRKKEKES